SGGNPGTADENGVTSDGDTNTEGNTSPPDENTGTSEGTGTTEETPHTTACPPAPPACIRPAVLGQGRDGDRGPGRQCQGGSRLSVRDLGAQPRSGHAERRQAAGDAPRSLLHRERERPRSEATQRHAPRR